MRTSKAFFAANLMNRSWNCSLHVNAPVSNQSLNLTSGRHQERSVLFPLCCSVALSTVASGFYSKKSSEETRRGFCYCHQMDLKENNLLCFETKQTLLIFLP